MKNSLIIIPTYNEVENIDLMIDTLFSNSHEIHVLIVDDSSPDGTGGHVRNLQNKYRDKLFLLERKQKNGGKSSNRKRVSFEDEFEKGI